MCVWYSCVQYKDDVPHGLGEFQFTTRGEMYKGSWDQGMRHGVGVYLYKSGAIYRYTAFVLIQ